MYTKQYYYGNYMLNKNTSVKGIKLNQVTE